MTTPLSPAERNTLRMADLTAEILTGRSSSPAQDAETITGFDYTNQAWVQNGRYLRCAHGPDLACGCFGKINQGKRPSAAILAEMLARYAEEFNATEDAWEQANSL